MRDLEARLLQAQQDAANALSKLMKVQQERDALKQELKDLRASKNELSSVINQAWIVLNRSGEYK